MINKLVYLVLFAFVLTSCQIPKSQPFPAQENSSEKVFEKPTPTKEEFDKDWPLQFATPLNDSAIHKATVDALRKTKAGNKNAIKEFCLQPEIQCYLQRISFPNEKIKRAADYTQLIHRELYKLNKHELAVFGYQKTP